MSGAVLDDGARQQDGQLVQRHREGDPTAFAELYATYHRRLLRYVRRRVNENHIAEDLTHEAFTRALSGIDNFRDGARFYSWLIGIARHLLIRHYRDTGRITSFTLIDAGHADAPELQLMRRVDHDYMTAALGRVRARHREVLRLREDEELSYEAIAERLGIPLTTVPPLLHRARLALRREYLAVTEPERTAALVPLLYGATAALRRLRDRLLQATAYLPDITALTTSIAVMAVQVAGMLGSVAPPSASAVTASDTATIQAELADQPGPPPHTAGATSQPRPRTDEFSPAAGLPRVLVSESASWRGREQDRHMPYYLEHGGFSIGVDPDDMRNDLESSLAGNYDWMEEQ